MQVAALTTRPWLYTSSRKQNRIKQNLEVQSGKIVSAGSAFSNCFSELFSLNDFLCNKTIGFKFAAFLSLQAPIPKTTKLLRERFFSKLEKSFKIKKKQNRAFLVNLLPDEAKSIFDSGKRPVLGKRNSEMFLTLDTVPIPESVFRHHRNTNSW